MLAMKATETTTDPYATLRMLVQERGPYERISARNLIELSLHIGMMMGGIALFLVSDSLLVKVSAMLLSTCGCLGIATSAHTSSHNATSSKRWLNRMLTYMGYPFFFGLSASYWWNKHCVVHHPTPNLVGVDDDIDLAPWFALTESDIQRGSGPLRLYYRLQWLLTPLALAFNEFNIQLSGWRFLISRLKDAERRKPDHWIDLGVLALHWATWFFLPMLFFSPLHVLAFYALRMMLMGYAMFVAFAPAHFPAEAVAAEGHQRTADFILRQTATTVNFRTGFFGRILCSGVEYQIEHHLFPGISHVHYPELSKVVKEFCQKNGYPYRTLGWGEAIWKSLVAFYRPKQVLSNLEVCKDGSVRS